MKKETMKLSAAILKGCKGTEQVVGEFFEYNLDDVVTRTCVIGAAYMGMSDTPGKVCLNDFWPGLGKKQAKRLKLPSAEKGQCISSWMVDRNDEAGWSRQRIARALAKVGL